MVVRLARAVGVFGELLVGANIIARIRSAMMKGFNAG